METRTAPFSGVSSVTLDLIRFLAAQMVVVGHGIAFAGIALWLQPPNFVYIQSMAVVIFFILSGILTSYSLFRKVSKRTNAYSFKTFSIERFSRIYSGYPIALLFVLVLDTVSIYGLHGADHNHSYSLYNFITNLLMLQDQPRILDPLFHITFFGSQAFGSGRPFWTMTPEWWMYMFLGFYVLRREIVSNRILNKLLYYSMLILFISLASVMYTLVLAWLAGVVITLLLSYASSLSKSAGLNEKTKLAVPFLILALSGACFGAALFRGFENIGAYGGEGAVYDPIFILWLAGGFFFLLSFTERIRTKFPEGGASTIRWLSGYTFTLFLIHYTIFVFIGVAATLSPYLYFLTGFAVSNATAIAIAQFTERRHLQFRAVLLTRPHLNEKSRRIEAEPMLSLKLNRSQIAVGLFKGLVAGAIAVAVLFLAHVDLTNDLLFGLVVGVMIGGIQVMIKSVEIRGAPPWVS